MPAGFDTAFARGKQLVADFRANKKFRPTPAYHCDGLDHHIEAIGGAFYGPIPAEIKIVEGEAK